MKIKRGEERRYWFVSFVESRLLIPGKGGVDLARLWNGRKCRLLLSFYFILVLRLLEPTFRSLFEIK